MAKLYLFPYKMGSRSSAALAEALNVAQIRHVKSKFRGKPYKTVINWGASELPPEVQKCKILNKLTAVRTAGNKLEFFRKMSSVHQPGIGQGDISHDLPRMVPWTDKKPEAEQWLKEDHTVVVRNNLTSHSGRGILIVEPGSKLSDAPLYTKYVPKDSEWRIHVLNGKVIFSQRKIKDPELEEPKTWKIRSHDNGFIFQHNDLKIPEDVTKQVLLAFKVSGLDFGAIDVIFNKKQRKAYVLEANCAPGLEGQTVEVYKEAFKAAAG